MQNHFFSGWAFSHFASFFIYINIYLLIYENKYNWLVSSLFSRALKLRQTSLFLRNTRTPGCSQDETADISISLAAFGERELIQHQTQAIGRWFIKEKYCIPRTTACCYFLIQLSLATTQFILTPVFFIRDKNSALFYYGQPMGAKYLGYF